MVWKGAAGRGIFAYAGVCVCAVVSVVMIATCVRADAPNACVRIGGAGAKRERRMVL
jgi:hypothetical protein